MTEMPWWHGIPPISVRVKCDQQSHELRWEAGQLLALDHPDAERERALTALGGEQLHCIQLLDAWQRYVDDVRVLVVASRGPADRLGVGAVDEEVSSAGGWIASIGTSAAMWSGFQSIGPMPAVMPAMMRRRIRHGGFAPYAEPHSSDLAQLLGLGAIGDRLVANVIAHCASRVDAGDDRIADVLPSLKAALYGRLTAGVRAWLGRPAMVQLRMLPPGSELEWDITDGVVRVGVGFDWLRDVWAKGLATMFGGFCLSAVAVDEAEWQLVAVGTDSVRRRITVRIS